MSIVHVSRRVLAAAVVAGLLSSVQAFAVDASPHALALTHVPAAVSDGAAKRIAPLPSSKRMKLAVNLPLRDEAGLKAFLQTLYDRSNPNYHHYLGVDEFTARFGPSASDYAAVESWATLNGFTVTSRASNRHILDIEGPVDVIDRALHVTMTSYRDTSRARVFFAPDREPTVDVGVPITMITGLDNFTLPQPRLKQNPSYAQGPIAHAGGSGPNGQFLPSDMGAAYYGEGPLTGAGQTVGVFSFDGYKTSDVDLYYTRTGMTSDVPINNVLVNGFSGLCGDGGDGCDDGEQVLDITNVIGMAPGITQILFYEGDSGPDILNRMATDNIAKVLSCSWGSTDMGHVNDPIFEEFQAQGQTYANATGDDGSYDANAWLPPSLNPLILQVGGTRLTTDGPGGPWQAESAWPDSGGGFYNPAAEPIPPWQQIAGVINADNGGSTTQRNDPDVAAEGDFDNPTVSNGHFETGYGGTSFAAPRWAGFIALANQRSVANGTGVLGFVNAAIYDIGTGADYADNFHDVASGSNGAFDAVAGYDLVTGWGSPVGDGLIGSVSGSTSAPGYVISAYPIAVAMTPGSTVTTGVNVAAINGFSDDVDLSISGVPAGVTTAFSPPSTSTGSILTFTAGASAPIGVSALTVTGTSGSATQTLSMSLLVGNAPAATIDASIAFPAVVVLGDQTQSISIANAANSIPLTFSAAAYASSDGSCTGDIAWLTLPLTGGIVAGGDAQGVPLDVTPATANLAPGEYHAEVCVTTNDPEHASVVVPVDVTVIPGPQSDDIFVEGFEAGETGGGTSTVFTFDVNQPVEDDQAGSALDLATGNYHTWNASAIDNINLYDDGTGLQVYWYNDVLTPPSQRSHVGGVAAGGHYTILQHGATIGPDSTFSNSISAMTNWYGGADGYIGVSFYNSQAHAINYGYIHLTTSSPSGFPAQVLDYGFDDSGAAVTIP
jgi:subtilase family serine protease